MEEEEETGWGGREKVRRTKAKRKTSEGRKERRKE